jgi:hypothetical protein
VAEARRRVGDPGARGSMRGPAIAALLVCGGVATVAWAEPAAGPVIAQGQDRVIDAILGRGEALAGGCRLGQTETVRAEVVAQYLCESGAVATIALRHPSEAAPGALSAGSLAVELRPTSGGQALGDAEAARLAADVAARARSLGAGFRWLEPEPRASTPAAPQISAPLKPPPPRPFSPYAALTLVVGALSLLAAAGADFARRRRRETQP